MPKLLKTSSCLLRTHEGYGILKKKRTKHRLIPIVQQRECLRGSQALPVIDITCSFLRLGATQRTRRYCELALATLLLYYSDEYDE
jgi:hypothetical protein